MTTFTADDHRFMAHALQLAERGLYTTTPNPRVGCVLVRHGEIVGEGWHEFAGGPHAEVHALRMAGERAHDATAYVTLEPCCHHGRTPPCSDALIAAGISRVVAAMEDPNPKVAGKGLAQLRHGGIDVASGLLAAQAESLNPGFVMRMRDGRPFIRCKLAMSVDGRTAMASGESKWITGPAAREDVQRLRARSSAIITGIGTVLADDPQLSVRLEGVSHQPLRVVLDPHLSTPPTAQIVKAPGKTLIVTACNDSGLRQALEAAGAEVVVLAQRADDTIDLVALMTLLAEREINEALLETGAILSGAMLHEGLIDELIVYMAPLLMGDGARGLFHTPGLEAMADVVPLVISDIRAVGEDWRITARIAERRYNPA